MGRNSIKLEEKTIKASGGVIGCTSRGAQSGCFTNFYLPLSWQAPWDVWLFSFGSGRSLLCFLGLFVSRGLVPVRRREHTHCSSAREVLHINIPLAAGPDIIVQLFTHLPRVDHRHQRSRTDSLGHVYRK